MINVLVLDDKDTWIQLVFTAMFESVAEVHLETKPNTTYDLIVVSAVDVIEKRMNQDLTELKSTLRKSNGQIIALSSEEMFLKHPEVRRGTGLQVHKDLFYLETVNEFRDQTKGFIDMMSSVLGVKIPWPEQFLTI